MFDIGGVILDYDEITHYTKISRNINVNPRLLISFVSGFSDQLELGKITINDAEKKIANKFGAKGNKIRWEKEFVNNSRPDRKVIGIVNRLHNDHVVVLASNTNIGDYRSMFGKNGTLKDLRRLRIFASCYMGVKKPDPEFYNYILRRMKFDAKNAVFIDNRRENVAAARKLGIRSIQFSNARSLANELKKVLNAN